MEILNPCYTFINTIGADEISLIYYSHLIPVFFVLFLAFLVFYKAPKNILSKIFLSFSVVFSILLIADLLTWVSSDYYLISSSWAPIDYFETILYILGLYFVLIFINKKDISRWIKIVLFIVSLPPLIMTISGNSIFSFNHSMCEAENNSILLGYRFFIQIASLVTSLIVIIYSYFKRYKTESNLNKKAYISVMGSLFLFLSIFGITSYISALTGIYEIHLYSLFITPLFLMVMTYSIFSLDIFNLRIISTYFTVFGFVILMAIQLLFVSSGTDRILTLVTLILSSALIYILFKNLKKESDQRIYIENLSDQLEKSKGRLEESNFNLEVANDKLKDLDKLKTEFLSLASHQLRSPLTAIKGYSSMILDGDYGKVNNKVKEIMDRILESSGNLIIVVEDLLNVSKIESGGMQYQKINFDIAVVLNEVSRDLSVVANKKGLSLDFNKDINGNYITNGDKEKLRQVLINLIDNSIKYTKVGSINTFIKNTAKGTILISIQDTGIGFKDKKSKDGLFSKFGRGEGARLNTTGSGLGLYLAKEIVKAHSGKIWVESEGENKGSTFYVELPIAK